MKTTQAHKKQVKIVPVGCSLMPRVETAEWLLWLFTENVIFIKSLWKLFSEMEIIQDGLRITEMSRAY